MVIVKNSYLLRKQQLNVLFSAKNPTAADVKESENALKEGLLEKVVSKEPGKSLLKKD